MKIVIFCLLINLFVIFSNAVPVNTNAISTTTASETTAAETTTAKSKTLGSKYASIKKICKNACKRKANGYFKYKCPTTGKRSVRCFFCRHVFKCGYKGTSFI